MKLSRSDDTVSTGDSEKETTIPLLRGKKKMSPLAKRIYGMIKEIGETEAKVARGAQIDRRILNNIKKDPNRGMHSTTLVPLAIYLGVYEDWLLYGREPKYRPVDTPPAAVASRFSNLSPAKQKILLARLRELEANNNNPK